jgi:hypothetical protein
MLTDATDGTRQENLHTMQSEALREKMERALPPFFTRQTAALLLGGLVSVGGLANLDCSGKGPPTFRLGKRIAYERASFVSWLLRWKVGELVTPPRKGGRKR